MAENIDLENEELQNALQIIQYTHRSLFWTGKAGTGKSTFLRTIAGETSPDEGEIKPAKGLRLEYLPQEKEPDPNNTILMEAFRTQSPLMKALFAYETALVQSERTPKARDIPVSYTHMTLPTHYSV